MSSVKQVYYEVGILLYTKLAKRDLLSGNHFPLKDCKSSSQLGCIDVPKG